LKEARGKRDSARVDVDSGIDPNDRGKTAQAESANAANTFENIAREWHEGKSST